MGDQSWWDEATAIYAEYIDLATSIDNVRFMHSPREANGPAHELARDSFLNKSSCNWVNDLPSFIPQSLVNDAPLI